MNTDNHSRQVVKKKEKEIDQEIKEKEENIKRYLIINDLDEYVTTNGKVCYREVLSNRFDSKAFKEKFGELYNLYLRKTKNLRFTFSY